MNESVQCLASLDFVAAHIQIERNLTLLEAVSLSTDATTELQVGADLVSFSDQQLIFFGDVAVSGAFNLWHQSGSAQSQAGLIVDAGFFGVLELLPGGPKVIGGSNCTFVQLTAQTPFTLCCNTSTAYLMSLEKDAAGSAIYGNFTVAPDPEAKGPSGSVIFSSSVRFYGSISVIGSADCTFLAAPELSNATISVRDSSSLTFSSPSSFYATHLLLPLNVADSATLLVDRVQIDVFSRALLSAVSFRY